MHSSRQENKKYSTIFSILHFSKHFKCVTDVIYSFFTNHLSRQMAWPKVLYLNREEIPPKKILCEYSFCQDYYIEWPSFFLINVQSRGYKAELICFLFCSCFPKIWRINAARVVAFEKADRVWTILLCHFLWAIDSFFAYMYMMI